MDEGRRKEVRVRNEKRMNRAEAKKCMTDDPPIWNTCLNWKDGTRGCVSVPGYCQFPLLI